MKNLAFLFLSLFCALNLPATDLSLSGYVRFGIDEEPLESYKVDLAVFSHELFLEDITDENGAFSFHFEAEFNGPNPIFGIVTITDFCTGEVLVESAAFLENFPEVEGVTLIACSDIDPPDFPQNCEAYLYYEQVEAEPYLIQFYDVSSLANPAQSWVWDFGDGNTSTEANPLHEYSMPGIYQATLTIEADSCESSFTDWVVVLASLSCDCEGPDEAVCFTLPDGERLIWPNSCIAECEGFTSDQYEPCGVVCQAEFEALQGSTPGIIQFNDNSTVFGAEITEWYWDFGDGGFSTEQNPSYAFSNVGMVDVSLRITTNGGCSSTLIQPVFISVVSNTEEAIGEGIETIQVFPNPSDGELALQLHLAKGGRYHVMLHNTNGQKLKQLSFDLPAGEQQLQLGLNGIPPGLAFLQVQGENSVKTLRIIRQ